MDAKELQQWREKLQVESERIRVELEALKEITASTARESSGDLSSYASHMADQGTDTMEREKQFLFASQEGRYLWHVNQALRRLYAEPDNFGKCHQCGAEIAFERLDALPHARLCITCKEKEEDEKRR